MIQDSRTNRYLEIGDKLVRRGKIKTAAAVYSRYADACVAEKCMEQAREYVDSDPIKALNALAKAERIVGASGEGRRLSAQAYTGLGQPEIAQRFLEAEAS